MGRILEIYIGFQTIITRTYLKNRWSKMAAQANLRKAIQFSGFLHQRILILRRLANQPKVRSTTQRVPLSMVRRAGSSVT